MDGGGGGVISGQSARISAIIPPLFVTQA